MACGRCVHRSKAGYFSSLSALSGMLNTRMCRGRGVKVILMDLNESNDTGLVLSRPAFVAMARHTADGELLKLGTVDVEYKRY
ncbi:hypothetical protein BHM03_00025426 [Ensete ventricosum]|nr:hypothetical protein BHM03_00025426 [Ensete ventricosum]